MLTIASRGSQLALWQATWVSERLASFGHECQILTIKTTGDRISSVPFAQVPGKGLFTKEIEEALLDGRADLAVHSLKDLPTEIPDGLTIAAVPKREDPRDAVIGKRLEELPPGSRIGTSSSRRAAQLRRFRMDFHVDSIRGNVDTRLRKLDEGQYDAIVLAAAGLRRLGWSDRITEVLSVDMMCPAVGQGALAIETRVDGKGWSECKGLTDPITLAAVTAERAFLKELGGGCQTPIAAHATPFGDELRLIGMVISPDGAASVRGETSCLRDGAEAAGIRLAAELLRQGASEILATAL